MSLLKISGQICELHIIPLSLNCVTYRMQRLFDGFADFYNVIINSLTGAVTNTIFHLLFLLCIIVTNRIAMPHDLN